MSLTFFLSWGWGVFHVHLSFLLILSAFKLLFFNSFQSFIPEPWENLISPSPSRILLWKFISLDNSLRLCHWPRILEWFKKKNPHISVDWLLKNLLKWFPKHLVLGLVCSDGTPASYPCWLTPPLPIPKKLGRFWKVAAHALGQTR